MGLASSRYDCTIGAKKKGVKFFFNFFFVGCGCSGVGARVWARGCGGVGVGVRGGGMEMGGRGMRQAGLGLSPSGWNGESSSQGVPIPDSDWRLGCDR